MEYEIWENNVTLPHPVTGEAMVGCGRFLEKIESENFTDAINESQKRYPDISLRITNRKYAVEILPGNLTDTELAEIIAIVEGENYKSYIESKGNTNALHNKNLSK